MRISPTIIALVGLTLPATALAQQWSAAQQEVWAFEKACWEARELEVNMACFHEDFMGWGTANALQQPTSKADRRATFARSLATEDIVFLQLQPVSIRVYGNTAIALYVATTTIRNKATNEEKTITERWTDVLMRDASNRWRWIADHGAPTQ